MSTARQSLEHSLIAAKAYRAIMRDYHFWIYANFDARQSKDKKSMQLARKSMERHLLLTYLLEKLDKIAEDKDIIDKVPILRDQKIDYVPIIRESAALMLRFAIIVRSLNTRPIFPETVKGLKTILMEL